MTETLERSLAILRAELAPSSADKARLRARIVAPALGGGAAPTPPLTRWAALEVAGSLALAGAVALFGTGLGVGYWLGRESPSASPAPVEVEAARAASDGPAPAAAAEVAALSREAEPSAAPSGPRAQGTGVERSPPSEARQARPRAKPRAPAAQPLNDELALLRRVERALRKADPALALGLLAELDERFPESRLVEEREAARHIANCRLGEPGAVARARLFLGEHPASVYRQRVQLACALDGELNGPGVAR